MQFPLLTKMSICHRKPWCCAKCDIQTDSWTHALDFDVGRPTQAQGRLSGDVLLADLIPIQAQRLQLGEVGHIHNITEAPQGELCSGRERGRERWGEREKGRRRGMGERERERERSLVLTCSNSVLKRFVPVELAVVWTEPAAALPAHLNAPRSRPALDHFLWGLGSPQSRRGPSDSQTVRQRSGVPSFLPVARSGPPSRQQGRTPVRTRGGGSEGLRVWGSEGLRVWESEGLPWRSEDLREARSLSLKTDDRQSS